MLFYLKVQYLRILVGMQNIRFIFSENSLNLFHIVVLFRITSYYFKFQISYYFVIFRFISYYFVLFRIFHIILNYFILLRISSY